MPRSTSERRGRHQLTRQQRGYGAVWERFRDNLFRELVLRYGPWCQICNANIAGTRRGGALLDHLIPPARVARPGSRKHMQLHRDERNLVLVCEQCNNKKQDRLPGELSDSMREAVEQLIRERSIVCEQFLCEVHGCCQFGKDDLLRCSAIEAASGDDHRETSGAINRQEASKLTQDETHGQVVCRQADGVLDAEEEAFHGLHRDDASGDDVDSCCGRSATSWGGGD